MRWIKITFLLLLSLAVLNPLASQSYGTSLGFRLGNSPTYRTLGLSVQHRLGKHITLEGIAQTNFSEDHTAHLLIEQHQSFLTRRLNFYVGFGFSMGLERSTLTDELTRIQYTTVDNTTIGADVLFGIETTLLSTNISIDVKPNFNLIGREPWIQNQVGISVRQVVVKSGQQKRKKNKRQRARKRKDRQKERADRDPWLGEWWEKIKEKKDKVL